MRSRARSSNQVASIRAAVHAVAFTAAFAAALASGCDDGSTAPAVGTRLRLDLTGFEPLRNGAHYEGWAILGGQPVSTGKFNVGDGGTFVTVDGAPRGKTFEAGRDIRGASAIVITIEPNGDRDATPAATKIVAGDVEGGTARLHVGHGSALGNAFTAAAGVFILATPTDGTGTNELSGVWFLDNRSGSPRAGLTLPALPPGWKYEGWAVINNAPVTTGTFTRVDAADEAAPFSGTQPGPPFPGEDFLRDAPQGLTFPTSLRGAMAVITVEPFPDDGPMPFTLKPLAAAVPATAANGVVLPLQNGAAAFPTGTATIQ
jgi:hypothetical protein